MRYAIIFVAAAIGGCAGGSSPSLVLHLDQPIALDWSVGVNGVDGYSGVETQGSTQSDWYFLASNDQGGMAPQTLSVLVPEGDGTVTVRPWWIILKDDTRGINCNSWIGTATTEQASGTLAVSLDAYCESQDFHISGSIIKSL